MKKLLLVLIYFLFTSCVTNYYIVVEEDTPIYNNADGIGESITVIPKGYRVNVTAGKKKYRKIKWEKYKGWAVNPVYNISSGNSSTKSYNSPKSNHRSSSTSTPSGGTVYVKGYTRKDGTYVRPHTRSAPKRR